MTAAVVGIGRFEDPRKSGFCASDNACRAGCAGLRKTPSCQGYARRFRETISFFFFFIKSYFCEPNRNDPSK